MPEYYPPVRQLPSGMPPGEVPFERSAGDSISLGQIFGVLRRRYRLVLVLTLLGLGAGIYLALKTPATYKAVATIRLAGERHIDREVLAAELNHPAVGRRGRSESPFLRLPHS